MMKRGRESYGAADAMACRQYYDARVGALLTNWETPGKRFQNDPFLLLPLYPI